MTTVHRLMPVFVLMLNLLLLGAALAANGRHGARNRAFARLGIALCLWSLGVTGLRWSESPTTALAWERILHLGVIAIPVLFAEYVRLMAGDGPRWRVITIGYVAAAFFVATLPTPLLMDGVVETRWGYVPEPGPLYNAFVAYFAAYMLLGVGVLVRACPRALSTFRRNRLRLILVGVSVALVGGAIDFARFLFGIEWLYPVGIPASGVFAVALGIAIVRYRLMNVGVAVRRVLLYAVTWVTIAPVLLVALQLIDCVVPSLLSGDPASSRRATALTVLTGLLLALPVMRKLEDGFDRIMFRRQRAMSEALVALNRELSGILDTPRLAGTLTSGLVTHIPVAHASLHVRTGEGDAFECLSRTTADDGGEALDAVPSDVALWLRATRRTLMVDDIGCETAADGPGAAAVQALERRHTALVVPITVDADVAAILVIGEKLSGEVFDPREIELVEILASRAATALKNARLYQDLERKMEELRATRDLYGRAREAGRAKEQFLAMLAHELRNPLAPIVNAAHVLRAVVGGDAQAAPMIATIQRQAQQLARIVDDLLDVSRVQLGKIRLAAEPLDLGRLAVQCVDALRTSGKGHGRAVTTEIAPEPIVVIGDSARLEQVLWNLLDNALKYSPPAAPVAVSVGRGGDAAVLRVRDEGIGIAPDMLKTIFEAFTQADSSLHRSQGGLGLGLALVRTLVEQHHGTVTAHSDGPGRGSLFEVRLPLAGTDASVPVDEPRRGAGRGHRRVLVVEDKDDAREALRRLLAMAGHEVQCTAEGWRALELAAHWRPDVALIDIGLPGIDGYEVAERLRRTPFGEEIVLVAVTGYGQADDERRAVASGFDAHAVKPVPPDTLLQLVMGGRAEPRSTRGG
jgi:signal transduction histidine kinase/ActR/RegA family two-component response regulator